MEEQILKIINNHESWQPNGQNKLDTAKEITSHVMKFIKWKDDNIEYVRVNNFRMWHLNKINTTRSFTVLKELYQYWINNVKHGK